MKPIILLFFFLITIFSCKEKSKEKNDTETNVSSVKNQEAFTESFKKQFEGTWQKETQFQTNTIKIQFEPGKNYATVIDIGSGEAPPLKYQALPKGNKLFAYTENEHITLEAKNNQLIFLLQPTTWNKDGTTQKPVKTVFDKAK